MTLIFCYAANARRKQRFSLLGRLTVITNFNGKGVRAGEVELPLRELANDTPFRSSVN